MSSNPKLIHNHVESIKITSRRMPLEVFPNLDNILMHLGVLSGSDSFQCFLQQWDVESGNDNGKLVPVEYIREWKIIVIGNHYGYTSIEHGVTQSCCVHLIAFHM